MAQNCPTADQLKEFVSGELAPASYDAVDRHLDGCATCQAALDTFDESDPLLAALAQPADGLAMENDAALRDLVDRAKAIPRGDSVSAHKQTDEALPTGTELGQYLLLELIGVGGMGRVYKAVHRPMQREVAVKVLALQWFGHGEARQRFRREVEACARLQHANIVAAHDAGEADGYHYLVMEYVPGRNLSDVVKQDEPIQVEVALRHVLQAAQGLEYAHGVGIVHRDIKPSNVLLDDKGVVKILDLGIARPPLSEADDSRDLTASKAMLGTAAYMAPEQAANPRKVDPRADIYSLGCTLFYLLTGKPVYEGETPMEVVFAHREQPVPSLRSHRPDCPRTVDDLFASMVAKRSADRPNSMAEVIAEIKRLLGDTTVGETMIKRRPRRSRLPIAWTVAAALTLLVVAITVFGLPPYSRTAEGPGTQVVDARPVAKPEEKPVDLLKRIDPAKHALAGKWAQEGGALLSPVEPRFADLRLPCTPPEEYVVTLTAERESGSDALRLGLVSGERRFAVVFDLDSDVTSFGSLEGLGPGMHPTAFRNTLFLKGKSVTVRCKVQTRDKRTILNVTLGDETLVAWAGETTALSDLPDAPKTAGMFIGAAKSRFRISKLELTPLIDGRPVPPVSNSPKIELVKIRQGEFLMGAAAKSEAATDQLPRHKVRISRPFLLSKYEVTRGEFAEVMELTPDENKEHGRHPIVGVSWLTTVKFCNRLSQRHGLKPYYAVKGSTVTIRGGDGFRLPTEAEWEYACRAGTETRWHFGDDSKKLDEFEWHAGNSEGSPQPVGKLKPNPWGLHDMHGNVAEWCWDRYDAKYYGRSEAVDPPGSSSGNRRVVRGGSASNRAAQTASATRTPLGLSYGPVLKDLEQGLPPLGQSVPGSRGVGLRVARSQ